MKASVILKIKIVGALTINAVGKNTFKGEEKLLTRQKNHYILYSDAAL